MITTEQKDNWVKALRSGEYKQGKRFLKNSSDEYCCLGVLAECLIRSGDDHPQQYLSDTLSYRLAHHWSLLPDWVMPYDDQMVLADLNDRQEKTFSKIADIIEADDRI